MHGAADARADPARGRSPSSRPTRRPRRPRSRPTSAACTDRRAGARPASIDDNYGLEDVRQQIVDNGFGDAADGSEVTITELVFASADRGRLHLRPRRRRIAEFAGQLGRARFLDGTWKITRATLCQDLSKAGVQCPP